MRRVGEITDVNTEYARVGEMGFDILPGRWPYTVPHASKVEGSILVSLAKGFIFQV